MVASKLVHIRLEADLIKQLDYLTVEHDLYRTDLIEMLLEIALEEIENGGWDLESIVEEYFDNEDSPD